MSETPEIARLLGGVETLSVIGHLGSVEPMVKPT